MDEKKVEYGATAGICSKTPLRIVLLASHEVYLSYDAFASLRFTPMCPSDNPSAVSSLS